MRAAGATLVAGVEGNLGHVTQHLAVQRYAQDPSNCIVPVRFDQVPATPTFDTVFSLGVLYHQRDPQSHLAQLRRFVRSGGELVIETLIADPGDTIVLADYARYARMRNVFTIASSRALLEWLGAVGFGNARIVDVTPTTFDEQRRTEWMPFESLAEALDPNDASRTIEGHRAPLRAVVIARGPP
jgi:tRNA (mo5U34)-methyltransferase